MFYEEYPTPEQIKTIDYEEMKLFIEQQVRVLFKHFVPFAKESELDFENYIKCTALIRLQDYCFIRTFCKNLDNSLNHLDIGPGLGSHSFYSLKGFNGQYYGLEASPITYSVQRQVFRCLTQGRSEYLDVIDCENLNLNVERIRAEINKKEGYKLKHIPSWHFQLVDNNSIDLVTASWVLNEVNVAGILWLIAHSTRVLKEGGYFYIRDSSKLKPLRHSINYDELLQKLGFKEVGRLDVVNRVDLYGVPRVYQKNTTKHYSFDDLVEMCLGKFLLPALGGGYQQNQAPNNFPKK